MNEFPMNRLRTLYNRVRAINNIITHDAIISDNAAEFTSKTKNINVFLMYKNIDVFISVFLETKLRKNPYLHKRVVQVTRNKDVGSCTLSPKRERSGGKSDQLNPQYS